MTTQAPPSRKHAGPRAMLNKVPEITVCFWVIKVLCTTVGETAADLLNENLGLGLTNTSLVMTVLLAGSLCWQLRTRRYVPAAYWLTVVLISVVGTLVSDNLVDNLGVPLTTTTTVFGITLIAVFGLWFANERTLSIHTIVTTPREAFYWLAILVTFALGTSAGDLVAEQLALGYALSALLFAGLIAVVAVAHLGLRRGAVTAFWIAYILTRPLGASIGDYLSQPPRAGGLGLGTIGTSALFLALILGLVVYLTVIRRDATENRASRGAGTPEPSGRS